MKSPRDWWRIDKALGQTPCICGAVDTWHPKCYHGKSDKEIEEGYEKAYSKARVFLRKQATEKAKTAIKKARWE